MVTLIIELSAVSILVLGSLFIYILDLRKQLKTKQEQQDKVKKRFENEDNRKVMQEYYIWSRSRNRLYEDFVDFYFRGNRQMPGK